MKRSGGPKIILKPRRLLQQQQQQQVETVTPSEADPEQELRSSVALSEQNTPSGLNDGDDAGDDVRNLDDDDGPADSDAPEGSTRYDGEGEDVEDADGDQEGEGDEEGEGDGENSGDEIASTASASVRRGRGRPRGRGNASTSVRAVIVGTGRKRGRPPGRGRPRGRPRGGGTSVVIRLPRRGGGESGPEEGREGEESVGTPGEYGDEGGGVPVSGKASRVVQGEVVAIEGDAFVTEDNPKGETKIDIHGNLLGGRQFKVQTFILPDRHPERKYMLAIEAARTSGFRDSLYYFRRNPLALKLNASQSEKEFLIEIGKLGGHLRTRSVTLVTARSAYKLHGAKMLIDGRIGIDDYYEDKAIAEAAERGLKPGDLASELLEQQQQAALDSAAAAALAKSSAVGNKGERSGLGLYRPGGPTTVFGGSGLGPYSDGPLHVAKKAMLHREGAKEETWMYVMAQRTSDANSEWVRGRAEALRGHGYEASASADLMDVDAVGAGGQSREGQSRASIERMYEFHTGIVHYESSTQPTRARWEVVDPHAERIASEWIGGGTLGRRRRGPILGGAKVGNAAWGLAWVDTVMEFSSQEHGEDHDNQVNARNELMRAVGIL